MIESSKLRERIRSQLFDGAFGISHPVIRCTDRYVLAFFITQFYADSMQTGIFNRPENIVTADLITGDLLTFEETRFNEFSDADYSFRYDLSGDFNRLEGKYLEETYHYLDIVRNELAASGTLNEHAYKMYMKRITDNIPFCYRRFYHELSSI